MGKLLVGFGTLLYRASVGDTIGRDQAEEKSMRPVVVKDHKRLFNLRPTHYESSAKLTTSGIENGAMNVEPASGHFFNALAFPVTDEELDRLDERERYYQRHTVELFDFETDELIGEGMVYMSDPNESWIERDACRLLPLWRDIVWARTGSYAVSEQFGETFDQTTFLADGKTLVVDRYADWLAETIEPGTKDVG